MSTENDQKQQNQPKNTNQIIESNKIENPRQITFCMEKKKNNYLHNQKIYILQISDIFIC